MTRSAGRHSYNRTRRMYGDAAVVHTKVTVPKPLCDWVDEFARRRNLSRSALILEAIELWAACLADFTEDDYGFTMPPVPGSQEDAS